MNYNNQTYFFYFKYRLSKLYTKYIFNWFLLLILVKYRLKLKYILQFEYAIKNESSKTYVITLKK